jgi:repressor LexA
MKYPLTKTQQKYFSFIKKYIEENNMSPSYRDIKKAMNINSLANVHTMLYQLEKRGWIKKLPASARSIVIND